MMFAGIDTYFNTGPRWLDRSARGRVAPHSRRPGRTPSGLPGRTFGSEGGVAVR